MRLASIRLSFSSPGKDQRLSQRDKTSDILLRSAGTIVSSHVGSADCAVAVNAIDEKKSR